MARTRALALRSKLLGAPALWTAGFYTLPTAILLVYTWYNTIREFYGFGWMVVSILTFPTCLVIDLWFPGIVSVPFEVLIGLAVNSIAIYLLAGLLSYIAKRWRA